MGKMNLSRVVKTKTKRGKRFLENRESKTIENVKHAMFIKGGKTNECVSKALKNFYMLKKPFSTMLAKKNILRPFEDDTTLEYLAKKNDHSLFMFGSNSKKRANNLVLGRLFDSNIMDMFEFGIEQFKPMEEFKCAKVTLGVKPCLTFNGEAFDTDPEYMRLKCLFGDFFRGEVCDNVRLQGIEHVINFTAVDGKIYFRSYKVTYKNSGGRVPAVTMNEIGPSFNFTVRRTKVGSDEVYRKSLKQPKEINPKKKKNVSRDALGSTLGRIHMEKQDLGKLQLRKTKGLKRGKKVKTSEAEQAINDKKEEQKESVSGR